MHHWVSMATASGMIYERSLPKHECGFDMMFLHDSVLAFMFFSPAAICPPTYWSDGHFWFFTYISVHTSTHLHTHTHTHTHTYTHMCAHIPWYLLS